MTAMARVPADGGNATGSQVFVVACVFGLADAWRTMRLISDGSLTQLQDRRARSNRT